MKTSFRKAAFIVFISIVTALVLYNVYIHANYYVGSGADPERVASIAVKKNNPRECEKIRQRFQLMGPSEEDQIQNCYFLMAHMLNDTAICSAYLDDEDYRNICIREIAGATMNPSLCEEIEDQSGKDSCYEYLK